jgi:hypothetical protein
MNLSPEPTIVSLDARCEAPMEFGIFEVCK